MTLFLIRSQLLCVGDTALSGTVLRGRDAHRTSQASSICRIAVGFFMSTIARGLTPSWLVGDGRREFNIIMLLLAQQPGPFSVLQKKKHYLQITRKSANSRESTINSGLDALDGFS